MPRTKFLMAWVGYLLQIIFQVKEASTPPNILKYIIQVGTFSCFLFERDISDSHFLIWCWIHGGSHILLSRCNY
ncbi:hypothetical protein BDA96_01G251700 [Sorghum bicolor]|uniref:Uncharacterized protein n=1 Tax=Sorghum bicolor TaxID=4558 RepID=A0A921RZX0_SORBI|nr:hypothetical protein BDA96_01G251700 [Sorghum bicolor]